MKATMGFASSKMDIQQLEASESRGRKMAIALKRSIRRRRISFKTEGICELRGVRGVALIII